ncbi:MAG: hypothetical protein F6J94_32020 [Moorea sp. SIO1F2]|uniref:hypothetical protein n=1 Tax=unclassified Moorena TaxID=2683338 RepID=UPI0013BAB177|nr:MULTISPECIES: hypothetical protein [unclassified Moorena]NEO19988.1 hypothetical protein [Moorena sp. SIO4A5]NEO65520.1 hypothetical protein [Moorena sp. SIO4G2]NEQ59437.1 hypothetical protein [Moorena sp. SIO4A1]NET86324.1 hypothetical protein [Moorena sp. SIO1F2]
MGTGVLKVITWSGLLLSLLPIAYCLLPIAYCLLLTPCSLKAQTLYLTAIANRCIDNCDIFAIMEVTPI